MTQVDFHILPVTQTIERYAYAARLVSKAARHGHRVLLAVDSADQAEPLSDALWGLTQDSFLAHGRLDQDDEPIQIGWHEHPGEHDDVLINLAESIPEFFSRFNRVFEVVSQQPEVLKQSREHYRFYQDRGYPLTRHDLRDRA